MYQWLLAKRVIESVFIAPFILLGRLIAVLRHPEKQFRIYFFFPFYHTGGAEKVHAQIAQAVGDENCIIYFTKKSGNEAFLNEFRKSGCVIRNISGFTDNKWLYFLNLIFRGIISGYINRQKKRPIVFNGQNNFAYKLSPWVNSDIPQVEIIHSLNTFSFIRIPFLPFITKTIMISKKRIQDHKELYKGYRIPETLLDRIHFIPNAISFPNVKIEKHFPLEVLYVGRATEEKRVWLVVQIAKLMQQSNPEIKFSILGDVSDVIDQSLYPYVEFYGNQNDPEMISSIYSRKHVLLLTSTTEGFPMVVMEAMIHGLAILATPVGDIPIHIQDGRNGWLFSTAADESIITREAIEKITFLQGNPLKFDEISLANRNYANEHFGIERFNSDYRNLFASVLNKN